MPAPTIHAFAEKVAVIAGGDTPVGRAVALQLALQGCYVIAASTASSAQGALEELERLGTLAAHVDADTATLDGATRLVDSADAKFGRIDLLVNCLPACPLIDFVEMTELDFDAAISSGTKSAFFVVREAYRLMKSRPKARIVTVVEAPADDPGATGIVRAAIFHSVAGMTSAYARSLPKSFRINAVGVSIKSREDPSDGELFLRPADSISPDTVARTVLFLLSGEAAGLNGEVLNVG